PNPEKLKVHRTERVDQAVEQEHAGVTVDALVVKRGVVDQREPVPREDTEGEIARGKRPVRVAEDDELAILASAPAVGPQRRLILNEILLAARIHEAGVDGPPLLVGDDISQPASR